MSVPLEARFWAKVDERGPSECWPWLGYRHPLGYGQVKAHGRTSLSHRVAYELAHGPIAPGMDILHACDNRWCQNPAHLRQGTHPENLGEMVQRGRSNRGEMRWSAKLTEAQVREIRGLIAEGCASDRDIAPLFGVSPASIRRIRHGEAWKHVAGAA